MVAVIFCSETSRYFNYNVSNQHWTSSSNLYNESNAQNKFTFKCWSFQASNVVHQLPSFCALFFAIFSNGLVLLIFVLQTFPSNHSPIYFVCSTLSSLETFWSICVLCVVKGILLDIGLNLWHSLVFQSQISNFPYSLNKSVSCAKLFSLKNFTLSLNEAPKAHYFCFLLLIQRSAVQKKSNKATLPNTKSFFDCKTPVVHAIAMFIASQFFSVFNISYNCWKSSHNLWTLPNHNPLSLERLGFRACYSASAQSPTAPFWNPNVLGELQESVLVEMADKSLRVELVIVSLLAWT